MVHAMLFAGGTGTRMKSANTPKQFIEVDGKPIIIRTLENFSKHPLVDDIVVSCIATGIDHLKDLIKEYKIEKVKAIAIGTSHGAYKFSGEAKLDFDRLKEIKDALKEAGFGDYPIVLHGSSSVPAEFVAKCNQFGGKLPNAQGVPEDMLNYASKHGVAKINIDTDLRLAMTSTIREFFVEHPEKFDPREYMGPGRTAVKEMVMHKMRDVLGTAGHADD